MQAKTVGISEDDTLKGHLEDKLLAGADISITKGNTGADETLTIASTYVYTPPAPNVRGLEESQDTRLSDDMILCVGERGIVVNVVRDHEVGKVLTIKSLINAQCTVIVNDGSGTIDEATEQLIGKDDCLQIQCSEGRVWRII